MSGDADRTPSKVHLGKGFPFPLKPRHGGLRLASHEAKVEQAVQMILLTSQGERVMLHEFGAGLQSMVFEPNTPATRARIRLAVEKALMDWEPRINLERVEVTEGPDPNVVLIHVDYVVRATNTSYNRVYPFYLLEGGG
jgi:phage baseplate assembly protein W